MRRGEFIAFLGSATTAWSLTARAQQPGRTGRMAALMMYPENDPQGQLRATIIRGELEKAGWTIGGNLQLDFHWGTGDAAWVRSAAAQVLGTAPDVILANGDAAVKAAQQATKTIPVIFIASGDPVGDGLVASLAHPGGNLTGFAVMQPSLGAKLLGMLKQVAPRLAHVGVLINPDSVTHKHILALLTAAAPDFAVDVVAAQVHQAAKIEGVMTQWGQAADYGVVVPSDPASNAQRGLVIELAARYRLPAIFALRDRRRGRRTDILRRRYFRPLPPCRGICRPHPQGRKTHQPAGAIADQIRAGDQPENRQSARLRGADIATRRRR
jgi:putative tryptophan/tyrosine transport system substrate-binding protein